MAGLGETLPELRPFTESMYRAFLCRPYQYMANCVERWGRIAAAARQPAAGVDMWREFLAPIPRVHGMCVAVDEPIGRRLSCHSREAAPCHRRGKPSG